MILTFGFDDNGVPDGVSWASKLFKKYGSASFFLASHFLSRPGVKNSWLELISNGHDIGNHTHSHKNGSEFSLIEWAYEITKCEHFLTSDYPIGLGSKKEDIIGFRAPYLAYNEHTLEILRELGYSYDCSTIIGMEAKYDGTNYPLPKKENGLWIMPCYPVIIPPDELCEKYGVKPGFRKSKIGVGPKNEFYNPLDGKITGLDYNMLVSFKMNREEFLATLKYTFDLRLEGNECPMLFGAHTDYYTSEFNMAPNISYLEMRAVIEEFLEYASSFNSVEILSYRDTIKALSL